jgi:ABC-type branched-subunit amino acid transport system substrate-binding protein
MSAFDPKRNAMPLINKLRSSGAQALFPLSYLNDSLFIIRTMRQQQITIPVIGGSGGYVVPAVPVAPLLFAKLASTRERYSAVPSR